LIIDTPGLREVGLIADEACLEALAPSMSALATECRFSDCSHGGEPGCAVQDALDDGALPQEDYDTYVKLGKEAAYNRRKIDARFEKEERKRWKKITIQNRSRSRQRF
jgi:ribosome biogenesis GTPase